MSVKKRALFVENDQIDEAAIKRATLPFECEIVSSVIEAKHLLQKQHFDVAVIDFLLDDGTCFDVLNFLEDIPYIVVTGAGSENIAVELMKCGAADYVVKDTARHYLSLLPTIMESAIKARDKEKDYGNQ